jgi:hypothetical protein
VAYVDPQMTIGNMRSLAVRAVNAACGGCRRARFFRSLEVERRGR